MISSGEVMKSLFDDIFESRILVSNEKDNFNETSVLINMKKNNIRPCEYFGGIFMLRFIFVLSKLLSDNVASHSSTSHDRRQRASMTRTDESDIGRNYLSSSLVVAGISDILLELEKLYPLVVV